MLTDISLQVLLFFDTNKILSEYETDGTVQAVKQKYLDSLIQLEYPENYLSEVSFEIDTDENVQKNFIVVSSYKHSISRAWKK